MLAIMLVSALVQVVPVLAGLQDVRLPACAEACLSSGLQSSNCSVEDVKCLCADSVLFVGLVTCAQHSCMPKDALLTVNLTSVTCNAPIRDDRSKIVPMGIAFCAATTVVVGLRFFQRLYLGSGLYADDYLILLSHICGIPCTVNLVVGLVGNGLGRDAWTLSFDNITRFLLFMYINEMLYFTQVLMVKLSILAFYLRLFPWTTLRYIIWATIAITVSLIVIFNFLTAFQCQPIAYYWQGWDGEMQGQCLSISALGWANAAFSIVLDLWMLGIPLSQLKKLQLHWKKKIGVALMFSVGVFVTAISILRLQFLVHFSNSTNPTWDQFPASYWSAVELNVSVCCACMPSMRLLLDRLFPKILGPADKRQVSPQSASRRHGAVGAAEKDPTVKIISSRGFQMKFLTNGDGYDASTRGLADDTDVNLHWTKDGTP